MQSRLHYWRSRHRMISVRRDTNFNIKQISQSLWNEKTLTVGHPVSAIYICGLFDSEFARATSCSWKKFAVHAAELAAETFANHGCTLAIYPCALE